MQRAAELYAVPVPADRGQIAQHRTVEEHIDHGQHMLEMRWIAAPAGEFHVQNAVHRINGARRSAL
ncbi:hypothetical protein IU443_12450 [Nocardia farcinica]|uniref:hypothetical protein n=1 Tax=Nocardia farcinica TaxID=37329 RepID=UPI0015F014CB|nr:hypothetical protein [Nocardia farcinica]MBF6304638.1 hypothetical protein [Nocardia farcinica]MBF6390758.1 hypothetical protein [Nocardia farcinica]MBF6526115.1 hypothetical protein [Nocardia farcinica]MBF6579598.1 hypothetical protein [Nocardia farcinica]MBF6585575.1 hypothetical protein [Nocardia farcinica]